MTDGRHYTPGFPMEEEASPRMGKLNPGAMYAHASLRTLQEAQVRALMPRLQHCAGSHGLLLSAGAGAPPALPMLGCWAHLRIGHAGYTGAVTAALDEAMPFVDEAFELVWLRHALEVVDTPHVIVREAVRVLAPGGVLVVTGVHPLSAWSPWFYWMTRGQAPRRLLAPMTLRRLLQDDGLELTCQQRIGRAWPAGRQSGVGGSCVGGGYVLVASKPSVILTPLRVRGLPLAATATTRLATPSGLRQGVAP